MQERKFLPIGTICTINNYNKKVMIVGYYAMNYNGNATIYDYKAYDYPEGTLLINKVICFNHSDINKIDFMGLKNDDYQKLNTNLNNQNSKEIKENSNQIGNFKFDSDGVVIYDPLSSNDSGKNKPQEKEKKEEIENPFYNKYVEKNVSLHDSNSKEWDIFKKIEFDENGYVISAETKI